jgi:hypothetical protein
MIHDPALAAVWFRSSQNAIHESPKLRFAVCEKKKRDQIVERFRALYIEWLLQEKEKIRCAILFNLERTKVHRKPSEGH